MSHKSQACPSNRQSKTAEIIFWECSRGDDLLEFALYGSSVVDGGNGEKFVHVCVEVLGIVCIPTEDQDFLVGAGHDPLPLSDKLLTEFLPVPFRYPHHIGRFYCLLRGHQNESLHAQCPGSSEDPSHHTTYSLTRPLSSRGILIFRTEQSINVETGWPTLTFRRICKEKLKFRADGLIHEYCE